MRLAKKLIQLRKEHGWTQAVAAREIDIQQSYLSKLENGRFIPSDEVIDKLCLAYSVAKSDLVDVMPAESPAPKYWIIGLLFGIGLFITGYFALIFTQTYYTYKASPLSANQADATISYHLTDQYNGELYVTDFDGMTYEYELIAERDILRKENRWLITSGLALCLLSLSAPLIRSRLKP